MSQQLFRKKSLDKISSPEQLNDYIRVANPSLWLILGALIVLLVGVCVWGAVGRLDSTVPAVVVVENGQPIAYIKEAAAETVEDGMSVQINEKEYAITAVSQTPVAIDDSFSEYALHLMDLHKGEWVYELSLDGTLSDGIYSAEIIVQSVSPLSFVLN